MGVGMGLGITYAGSNRHKGKALFLIVQGVLDSERVQGCLGDLVGRGRQVVGRSRQRDGAE
jgi:hypothetical protein